MMASRVYFREGQILRAADLNAEQAYRIDLRRRHNIAQHNWGIVFGLELVELHGDIVLSPGMAVDGYGRELIVTQAAPLPSDIFEELDATELTVWLLYDLVDEHDPTCSRWREATKLMFLATDENPGENPDEHLDPRFPPAVRADGHVFGPHRSPPDDPEVLWPVYLGCIKGEACDSEARPYATLVGEAVTAPSGFAHMQVGSEAADDPNCFVVRVQTRNGEWLEPWQIDRNGHSTFTGPLLIVGDLVIGSAALHAGDLLNAGALIERLKYHQSDPLSEYIYGLLPVKARELVDGYDETQPLSMFLVNSLIDTLNDFLWSFPLDEAERFHRVRLRDQTKQLINAWQQDTFQVQYLNRLLLDYTYSNYIKPLSTVEGLRSLLVTEAQILEIDGLVDALKVASGADDGSPEHYLYSMLTGETKQAIHKHTPGTRSDDIIRLLVRDWNNMIQFAYLYDSKRSEAANLPNPITEAIASYRGGVDALALKRTLGRMLLEDAYPHTFARLDAGVVFEQLDADLTSAAPWQIYRVAVTQNAGQANEFDVQQLRMEIGNPGKEGDPQRHQFAIGVSEQDGSDQDIEHFLPCLTVQADGTVTMHGNLEIEDGQLVESPIGVDLHDPRFGALMIDSFTQAHGAAAVQSEAFYSAELVIALNDLPAGVEKLQDLSYGFTVENISDVPIPNIRIFEELIVPSINYTTGASPLMDNAAPVVLNLTPGQTASAKVPENYRVVRPSSDPPISGAVEMVVKLTAWSFGPTVFTEAVASVGITLSPPS